MFKNAYLYYLNKIVIIIVFIVFIFYILFMVIFNLKLLLFYLKYSDLIFNNNQVFTYN